MHGEACRLVLVLAHTGISTSPPGEKDENAASISPHLPGIDAIHRPRASRLPGPVAGDGVDFERGVNGVPTVMGGFSALSGQIDLVPQGQGASCLLRGHRGADL